MTTPPDPNTESSDDLDRRLAALERRLVMKREELELQGKINSQLIEEAEGKHRLSKENLKLHRGLLANMELQKQELKLQMEKGPITDEMRARLKQLTKDIEENKEALEELTKEQTKYNQELQAGEAIAKNYGQALFGLSGAFSNLYTKYIPKTAVEFEGMLKKMKKNITSFKFITSAALKFIGASFNLMVAQDKATAAFQQATGAGDKYNDTLWGIESAARGAGVTMDEAGKATLSLFSTYRDFTNLNKEEAKRIGTTVALMNELGVSTDTSAKIMDQATKSLGMTSGAAEQMLLQVTSIADQIGKPFSEVAADLASAAPKLAFYGENMINVFKRLEQQSKSTGLSVDSILGLVGEGFDTFEGAATKVGKLNAILGGPYLNSIDMLNSSEEDRLEIIKQSIEAAGVQFDQLGKFEQKNFASALGTDVDTLRRAMGALSDEEELEMMNQERLAQLAAESKDVMEELKNAFRSLILENKQLVKDVSEGVSKFSKWIKENKEMLQVVGKLTIALAVFIKVVQMGMVLHKLALAVKAANGALWAFAANPWTIGIAAAVLLITGLVMWFKKLKKSGYSTSDAFVEMGMTVLKFLGPLGIYVRTVIEFVRALRSGESAMGAFKAAWKGFANQMTFGIAYSDDNAASRAKTKRRARADEALAMQAEKGATWDTSVEDGVISGGKAIKVHNKDTLVAAKPGGPLQKMFATLAKGAANATPLGMLPAGAFLYLAGPILKEAITKPLLSALGGAEGGAEGTGNSPDINIVVKIGEKELNEQIITALNSPAGAAIISPYAQR